MGAFLGLLLGVGLFLILRAFTTPPTKTTRLTWRTRVEELLAQAGIEGVAPGQLIGVSVVLGLLGFLVVAGISKVALIGLVFGAFAAAAPFTVVRSRRRKRNLELREVWPEVVDNLASGIRAGLSLPEAVSQLVVRGPELLRPQFDRFAADYRATGRFGECLDRLKDELADPVGDRVVEGLRIAREVGGGELGRLLRNLSGYLRDDARTRSEMESRQAWTVNGARLAVAAPWLVLLIMSFQSDVIHRYASPAGVVVLAVGASLCVAAYWLMMRIGRLPVERRILR